MKRFKKDNKKVIVGIISLVLIGIVICVAIYKSHAYFETSKTYNVLEGKIPNFSGGDITLAVKVDGEKREEFPEKGDYIVWSDCSNGMSVDWDYEAWKAKINSDITKPFVCNMNFKSYDKFINNITYNGEVVDTYPAKGNLSVSVSCNNIEGKWNYDTWKPVLSGANKDTVCDATFEDAKFNFGDGSLNTIASTCELQNNACSTPTGSGGYIDKLAIYDTDLGQDIDITKYRIGSLYTGNYYRLDFGLDDILYQSSGDIVASSGVNELLSSDKVVGDENSIIGIIYMGGNYGFSLNMRDFAIFLDNNYYTLKEAVEKNKIKPIVIMSSGNDIDSYQHIATAPTNLYDGGIVDGRYIHIRVYFMLNENVTFEKIKFTIDSNISSYENSIFITKINNKIIHLK